MVSPQEDHRTWLKYASLCRKSGRLSLSHKTLVMLLGSDPSQNADPSLPVNLPHVTFAYCKHMWCSGQHTEAFSQLHRLVHATLLQPSQSQEEADISTRRKLLAR